MHVGCMLRSTVNTLPTFYEIEFMKQEDFCNEFHKVDPRFLEGCRTAKLIGQSKV